MIMPVSQTRTNTCYPNLKAIVSCWFFVSVFLVLFIYLVVLFVVVVVKFVCLFVKVLMFFLVAQSL